MYHNISIIIRSNKTKERFPLARFGTQTDLASLVCTSAISFVISAGRGEIGVTVRKEGASLKEAGMVSFL